MKFVYLIKILYLAFNLGLKMKNILFTILAKVSFVLLSNSLLAQETEFSAPNADDFEEEVQSTFLSTRIINGHSVEVLEKKVLEFRVEHRFGDLAGDEGGIQTMYGLDNSSDIRLAFEYGITEKIMAGIGRSKGTGEPYRSLLDGFLKYKFLSQKKGGFPFSAAVIGSMFYSYMKASSDVTQVSYFPKNIYRLSYATQLNVARKFGEKLSLAIMPTLTHRNYVMSDDINTMFSIGGAVKYAFKDNMACIIEYYQNVHSSTIRTNTQQSLGIAFEFITFGHNFTINLTNAKGFGETQFIPYTYSDWLKGQFRLGFCIGRKFAWD